MTVAALALPIPKLIMVISPETAAGMATFRSITVVLWLLANCSR
jgi:hypothetical protein